MISLANYKYKSKFFPSFFKILCSNVKTYAVGSSSNGFFEVGWTFGGFFYNDRSHSFGGMVAIGGWYPLDRW